jgi:hypothetical protein
MNEYITKQFIRKMAKRRKSSCGRKRRRRGGTARSDALRGIGTYKKIAGALGLRKGLAQAGKMITGAGMKKLGSFLNR